MLPNSVEENSPSPVTNVEPASNERDNTTESSPPATTADTNPPVENTTTGATEGDGAGNDTEATANPENATNQPDGTQAGAPPTYEESANHLTLEYGGYFLPYDSRPMTSAVLSPAASVLSPVTPSLSLSRMNPPRRTRSLQEAQHNDLRSHHSDITPIGRRSRRVGDVTPSDRVQTQTVTTTGEQEELSTHDKCTKLLLPPMHICMATTCLVFNCVLPGSGTLVAAFALFCCTKPSDWSCGKKIASNCLSLLVALAQLILTPVLLIGWIWSILWGFAYVGVSHQEYHGIKDDDEEDEEEGLEPIGSGRRTHDFDEDDPSQIWSLGFHRYDHQYSAPSVRRMSIAAASGAAREQSRGQRMLRATRSYGYVEVHGRNALYHPNIDNFHSISRAPIQRPSGSASSSITNRPVSQTTLTSYINDGMLNVNTASQRRDPASMVAVNM